MSSSSAADRTWASLCPSMPVPPMIKTVRRDMSEFERWMVGHFGTPGEYVRVPIGLPLRRPAFQSDAVSVRGHQDPRDTARSLTSRLRHATYRVLHRSQRLAQLITLP